MSTLPSGYKRLEYIASTGSQYIDTGYVPNENTRIVATFQLPTLTSAAWVTGCRIAQNKAQCAIQLNVSKGQIRFDFGSVSKSINIANLNDKFYVDFSAEKIVVNGTEYSNSGNSFTTTNPIYLFALNGNGTPNFSTEQILEEYKIYEGSVLVRDYTPCMSDAGTVGLYDFVSDELCVNLGSGTFIAGPEVVSIEDFGLITDRTSADVLFASNLSKKPFAQWTEEERRQWLAGLKGSYNASDLNRVNYAIAYLQERLLEVGFHVDLQLRTDWNFADLPTRSAMMAYLDNIRYLREFLKYPEQTPIAPTKITGFNYEDANNIERILLTLDEIITNIMQAWFYSNEVYSGEV